MRVFVEGNIGAGKSTFLEYLKDQFKEPDVKFIPEPIEKWENFCGFNLLKEMYKQPATYGTAFQMYAMLTAFETITETANANLAIIERSLLSMKHVFIPTMRTFGYIPEATSYVFEAWIDFIIENQKFKPDVIIYIKTSAHVIQERIRNRGRQGEEEVDYNRLLLLQVGYEKWIKEMIYSGEAREFRWPNGHWIMTAAFGGFNKTAIITLNGDLSGDEMTAEYKKCVKLLMQLLKILNR